MAIPVFVKTPLFWSIFLLFGVVFNYHAFDLGETYVSRNLERMGGDISEPDYFVVAAIQAR